MAGTRRSTRSQNTDSSEPLAALKTRNATKVSKSKKPPIATKTIKTPTHSTRRKKRDTAPPETVDEEGIADGNGEHAARIVVSKAKPTEKSTVRVNRGRAKAINDTIMATPFSNITGNTDPPRRPKCLVKGATSAPTVAVNTNHETVQLPEENARVMGQALRQTRGKAGNKKSVTKLPAKYQSVPDRQPTRKGRQLNASSLNGGSGSPQEITAETEPGVAVVSEELSPAPAKHNRSRKDAVPQKNQELAKRARAARGKKAIEAELPLDTMDVSHDMEGLVKPRRTTRGRKAVLSESKPEVTATSKEELRKPVKKARASRGAKAVEQPRQVTVPEDVPEPVKSRTTRKRKNADTQPQQQVPAKKARASRGVKAVDSGPVEQPRQVTVPEEVPELVKSRTARKRKNTETQSQQQEPVKKPRASRAKKSTVLKPIPEPIGGPDEPSIKVAEPEVQQPVQQQEPARRTRVLRINQMTEPAPEPENQPVQPSQTPGKKAADVQEVVAEMQPSILKTPGKKAAQPVSPAPVATKSYHETEVIGGYTLPRHVESPPSNILSPSVETIAVAQWVVRSPEPSDDMSSAIDSGPTKILSPCVETTTIAQKVTHSPRPADHMSSASNSSSTNILSPYVKTTAAAQKTIHSPKPADNSTATSSAINSNPDEILSPYAETTTGAQKKVIHSPRSADHMSSAINSSLTKTPSPCVETTTVAQKVVHFPRLADNSTALSSAINSNPAKILSSYVETTAIAQKIIHSPGLADNSVATSPLDTKKTGCVNMTRFEQADSNTSGRSTRQSFAHNSFVSTTLAAASLLTKPVEAYATEVVGIPIEETESNDQGKSLAIDPKEDEISGDPSGIPPKSWDLFGILGTPPRRSFLARDAVLGTPVAGFTPLGAPMTPNFGFGSPLIRDSFANPPVLSSPVTPLAGQPQVPAKSPSPILNTPIKVFSPATRGSPNSVRSVMASPSKSSIMDDGQRFGELSPSTSKVVAGNAGSPVKQPGHQGGGLLSSLPRDGSRSPGYDSLFDGTFTFSESPGQGPVPLTGDGSRQPGYDSLFDGTFSLSSEEVPSGNQTLPNGDEGLVDPIGSPALKQEGEGDSGIRSSGSTIIMLPPLSLPSPSPPSSPFSTNSSSMPSSPEQSPKREVTGVRKSPRSVIWTPAISLAPVSSRPVGPLTWETMLDRERRVLVKKNTQLNCVPAPHKREVERKPIPRPPSPNAALQTMLATYGRRKRKAHFLETGIELGAGDKIGFEPKFLTPPKKGVRWGAPLESGYSSEPETHSPSQAEGLKVEGNLVKGEVALDKFGNLEGASPLKGGTPVVIKKVLYRGEME